MRDANWLPVGSVVVLKDGAKPIMVAGVMVEDAKTGRFWDYMGWPYPEGRTDPDIDLFFDAGMIRELRQLGFADREALLFQAFLRESTAEYEQRREGGSA